MLVPVEYYSGRLEALFSSNPTTGRGLAFLDNIAQHGIPRQYLRKKNV